MINRAFLTLLVGLNKVQKAIAEPNAFTCPLNDFSIHAGQTMEITWIETSGDTVDIYLTKGEPANLERVTTIATNEPNQGSAVWKLPSNIVPGKYSMQIVSDNGVYNYSPFFKITDPVTPIKAKSKSSPQKAESKVKSRLSNWLPF